MDRTFENSPQLAQDGRDIVVRLTQVCAPLLLPVCTFFYVVFLFMHVICVFCLTAGEAAVLAFDGKPISPQVHSSGDHKFHGG